MRRVGSPALAAVLALGLLLAGCTGSPPGPARTGTIDHVVIIVMENKAASRILGADDAPYFNRLAKDHALAANYHAVTRPSLPNYLALTSGTTAGITSNCEPEAGSCQADVRSIADEISQVGAEMADVRRRDARALPGR